MFVIRLPNLAFLKVENEQRFLFQPSLLCVKHIAHIHHLYQRGRCLLLAEQSLLAVPKRVAFSTESYGG